MEWCYQGRSCAILRNIYAKFRPRDRCIVSWNKSRNIKPNEPRGASHRPQQRRLFRQLQPGLHVSFRACIFVASEQFFRHLSTSGETVGRESGQGILLRSFLSSVTSCQQFSSDADPNCCVQLSLSALAARRLKVHLYSAHSVFWHDLSQSDGLHYILVISTAPNLFVQSSRKPRFLRFIVLIFTNHATPHRCLFSVFTFWGIFFLW
jgi:hypothetical protein